MRSIRWESSGWSWDTHARGRGLLEKFLAHWGKADWDLPEVRDDLASEIQESSLGCKAATFSPAPVQGRRVVDDSMTAKAKKLLDEALELSPEERADMAAVLLDSLDGQEEEGVEEAWAEEIARRIQEVETGAVKTIGWVDARRRLHQVLDARKRS